MTHRLFFLYPVKNRYNINKYSQTKFLIRNVYIPKEKKKVDFFEFVPTCS